MIRWLISALLYLAANALGLWIADLVLDGMSLSGSAFITAVLLFTLVEVLVSPLFTQMTLKGSGAMRGSVALVATFVGLLVTSLVNEGLTIDGFTHLDRGDGDRLAGCIARRSDPASDLREEGSGGQQLTRREAALSPDCCGQPADPDGGKEEDSTARIARAFDRQNAGLSSDPAKWPRPSPVTLRLLEMLDDVTTVRPTVLEIGCGTGAASVRLAQQGARQVTGIDLSPSSIEIALQRAENAGLDDTQISFVVGDGASSALEPHDWVILDRVICCYPSVERLLANAAAAAGSRLAFAVPESKGWRGSLVACRMEGRAPVGL